MPTSLQFADLRPIFCQYILTFSLGIMASESLVELKFSFHLASKLLSDKSHRW